MAQPEFAAPPRGLAHHFHNLAQQRAAAELGMWLFLATEFMFFGGMFLAYFVYRAHYPLAFVEGSHSMQLVLGTLNTAVLLTSSLTMALAVDVADHPRSDSQRAGNARLMQLLLATAALGMVFLGIKAYEYYEKFVQHHIPFGPFQFSHPEDKGLATFFNLYFLMTGFHALHMIIGLAFLLLFAYLAWRGRLGGVNSIAVSNFGLYWHFVDLVWVYLFPFFYLLGALVRSGTHG